MCFFTKVICVQSPWKAAIVWILQKNWRRKRKNYINIRGSSRTVFVVFPTHRRRITWKAHNWKICQIAARDPMQYIQFCQVLIMVRVPSQCHIQQLIRALWKWMFRLIFQVPGNSGRKQYTGLVNLLQAKFNNVRCGGPYIHRRCLKLLKAGWVAGRLSTYDCSMKSFVHDRTIPLRLQLKLVWQSL
jgi:hypothetical protein